MTLDEIANYCQVKDCRVHLGSPETGYITVDGEGAASPAENNYRRFLAFNELSALPNPRKVLETATQFTVEAGAGNRTVERAEFEQELQRFFQLIGA